MWRVAGVLFALMVVGCAVEQTTEAAVETTEAAVETTRTAVETTEAVVDTTTTEDDSDRVGSGLLQ
jgi:hypothetical protein